MSTDEIVNLMLLPIFTNSSNQLATLLLVS